MTGILQKAGILLLLISAAACSSSTGHDPEKKAPPPEVPLVFKPGTLYKNLACKSDPAITYAIYFPASWKEGTRVPLILAFDPEGNGLLPVTQYKSLADQYGFILAGSNNSKNGLSIEETERILGNLYQEIANQLPSDTSNLFLAGFSGGSRVASIFCMFQPGIRGMIGCGAGLANTQQQLKNKFNYFGIAGNADFNLQELILLMHQFETEDIPHELVIFKGKHEWPPAEVFSLGVQWQLNGGRKDNTFTRDRDKLLSSGEIFNMSLFGKATRDKEIARQKEFQDAFFARDLSWWRKEVAKLRDTVGLPGETAMMNQRLLSYLSLLCYSQSNKSLAAQNREAASYSIILYELVDPENPEVQRMKGQLATMP